MKLTPVLPHQAGTVLNFIEQAKAHLKTQGIDQWQQGYPNLEAVLQDVAERNAWFMTVDGTPVGYLCLAWEGEPIYATLDGAWLQNGAYVVVHRFTVGAAYRGKGYATAAFAAVEEVCRQSGIPAMRVDTHSHNTEMQRVLEKAGFTLCGTVHYPTSGPRLAFEKLV